MDFFSSWLNIYSSNLYSYQDGILMLLTIFFIFLHLLIFQNLTLEQKLQNIGQLFFFQFIGFIKQWN